MDECMNVWIYVGRYVGYLRTYICTYRRYKHDQTCISYPNLNPPLILLQDVGHTTGQLHHALVPFWTNSQRRQGHDQHFSTWKQVASPTNMGISLDYVHIYIYICINICMYIYIYVYKYILIHKYTSNAGIYPQKKTDSQRTENPRALGQGCKGGSASGC